MRIPLFKKDRSLIARIHSGADYQDRRMMEWELETRSRQFHSRAVLLDVTDLEIMGSVAIRILQDIAISDMLKVRGAQTVIAGIEPGTTVAMIKVGMTIGEADATLHVEEGLEYLAGISRRLSNTQSNFQAMGFRPGFCRNSRCGPDMFNVWLTFGPQGRSMLGRWRWPTNQWFGYCRWHILVGKSNRDRANVVPHRGVTPDAAVV